MAMGRIISKKICLNKAVNEQLSSDSCRLAFTWTIPHLDRDGRIHGDPRVLRAIIFPRREDITDEIMEGFIKEWVKCGLVIWYKANNDKWLQFPKFRQNQPKLRYERETPSTIPPPEKGKPCGRVPDKCRTNSGKKPDGVRRDSPPIEGNIREFNIREENLSETAQKPEQAPKDQKPDGALSPTDSVGSKPRDKQLQALADHLRKTDKDAWNKFVDHHPEFLDKTAEVAWPPQKPP